MDDKTEENVYLSDGKVKMSRQAEGIPENRENICIRQQEVGEGCAAINITQIQCCKAITSQHSSSQLFFTKLQNGLSSAVLRSPKVMQNTREDISGSMTTFPTFVAIVVISGPLMFAFRQRDEHCC